MVTDHIAGVRVLPLEVTQMILVWRTNLKYDRINMLVAFFVIPVFS